MPAYVTGLAALVFVGVSLGEDAAVPCEPLLQHDFSQLPNAPTQLTEAGVIPAEADTPAQCAVQGYVAPQVRFAVRMPTPDDWNGRLIVEGCGGLCGSLDHIERCRDRVARGYACATTDMGHYSTPFDAKWAYNNRSAEIDFAHRATHVATVAAKAIVNTHYGAAASRTYFHGCSTGGRQGLVAVQRYPEDFDAVIVGAPVLRTPASAMMALWTMRVLADDDGRPLLSTDDVRMLHDSVIDRCDDLDGRADGVVDDPDQCPFDPGELSCERTSLSEACLSQQQINGVRLVYDGPQDSRSRSVFPGPLLGSEMGWIGSFVVESGPPDFYAKFIGDVFRYVAFAEDPGPTWRLTDFDFDRDPARLQEMNALFSGVDPDLSAYFARGGKLLLYHGLADSAVVPQPTVDYFDRVSETLGSDETAANVRLFLIPGMGHCGGGKGPNQIDYLSAMEGWRERGETPASLEGVKVENGKTLSTREYSFYQPASAKAPANRKRGSGSPTR